MIQERIQYGGFWRRLGALLLDFVFLFPLFFIHTLGAHHFQYWELYALGPMSAFTLFYGVHLVRRFGGTPGKLLMGLRIRKVDGSEIGYREALLRYLPDFLLWLLFSIGMIAGLLSIVDDPALRDVTFIDRNARLREAAPVWLELVEYAQQAWVWSELLVLLTNRKRRALHDFIAGTVVVVQEARVVIPARTEDCGPGNTG